MTDALDLLKKDWDKTESKFKSFTESDIYKMLHNKSTSIVKWIFYISIVELIFWLILSQLVKNADKYKKIDSLTGLINLSEIVSYIILAVFIFLFYKNFKNINTTDSVKQLMSSIIQTRKTVNLYIKVFIGYNIMASLIVLFLIFRNEQQWQKTYEMAVANGQEMAYLASIIIGVIIFLLLTALALWLFYRLVYGILLKQLYKNYNELKKMDL